MRIESVDWFDPRAVALRDAMGVETGAMYEPLMAAMPPEEVAAIDVALAVDPAEMVAAIIALDGDEPIGHAALRPVSPGSTTGDLEVKKVYVTPQHRGRGVSKALMLALEDVARERGVDALILQTGELQDVAIALYLGLGYQPVPPFGRYANMALARCYRKTL